jgi:hypothetical protein
MLPMVAKIQEFKALHQYNTTRIRTKYNKNY